MTTKLNRRKAKQIIKDALKSVKEYRKEHVTVNKGYDTIQRNEPCPCESRLKYKDCCLKVLQLKEQEVYENIHARKRRAATIKKAVRKLRKNKNDNGSDTGDLTNSPLILPDSVRTQANQKIIIP